MKLKVLYEVKGKANTMYYRSEEEAFKDMKLKLTYGYKVLLVEKIN